MSHLGQKCTNLPNSVLTLMWKRFIYCFCLIPWRIEKGKKTKLHLSDSDSSEEPKKVAFYCFKHEMRGNPIKSMVTDADRRVCFKHFAIAKVVFGRSDSCWMKANIITLFTGLSSRGEASSADLLSSHKHPTFSSLSRTGAEPCSPLAAAWWKNNTAIVCKMGSVGVVHGGHGWKKRRSNRTHRCDCPSLSAIHEVRHRQQRKCF